MKRKRVIGAAVVVGVLLSGIATSWVHHRATAATAEVRAGELAPRVIARGTIAPRDGIAEVRSRVDGRVLRVEVREGDVVEAGQLLAELDGSGLETELARREAEERALLASARGIASGARPEEASAIEAEARAAAAEADLATDEATRETHLYASGSVPVAMRDATARRASAAHARADAVLARLRLARGGGRSEDVTTATEHAMAGAAAVRRAQHDLDEARLVSPIAGVVLARHVDVGDTVSVVAGAPVLFEIADTTQTEARLELEEADASRVTVGLVATMRGPGGEVVGHGRVARIAARYERRTVLGDPAAVRADGLVRAAWVTWDAGAAPTAPVGTRVEASIELPKVAVTARVPRAAVRIEDGAAIVDVRQGLFSTERQVELGVVDDESVEVRGLADGAKVVVR